MSTIGRTAAILAVGLASTACSSAEYRPLADDEVVQIEVFGYNDPFVQKGVEYRGFVQGFIEKEGTYEPGVRSTNEGEFLPDTFVVNDGQEEKTLSCIRFEDIVPNYFQVSVCSAPLKQAEPGQVIRAEFNGFDGSTIVMPELSKLTSPEENAEFSISSEDDLVLTWEPVGKGDSLSWGLSHVPNDVPGSCVHETAEYGWSGDIEEDSGSFVIPKDELPYDVPEGGCLFSLYYRRSRSGTVDPDIKAGFLYGTQQYAVRIILKP